MQFRRARRYPAAAQWRATGQLPPPFLRPTLARAAAVGALLLAQHLRKSLGPRRPKHHSLRLLLLQRKRAHGARLHPPPSRPLVAGVPRRLRQPQIPFRLRHHRRRRQPRHGRRRPRRRRQPLTGQPRLPRRRRLRLPTCGAKSRRAMSSIGHAAGSVRPRQPPLLNPHRRPLLLPCQTPTRKLRPSSRRQNKRR